MRTGMLSTRAQIALRARSTADMRSALVDYFREKGRIMIATEAGAEGINLQFCSLVVNYDLPWNPQRIEQRIGRCHRYGQKHDVVVVNFLNRKNEADQRVYQLLSEKFNLFEGVFGASDEVLGAIESGVDFEKRIGSIYQQCRQTHEIKTAFDQLQLELSLEINEAMSKTKQKLFENFDDEVREKLKVRDEATKVYLDRFEQLLMRLTAHELADDAEFIDTSSFNLKVRPPWVPGRDVPLGLYELPRRTGEAHLFRMGHPLGYAIIERAKLRNLQPVEIEFNYSHHLGKISLIEELRGKSGWLGATVLTVGALDQIEDHVLLAGQLDDGRVLDDETSKRLLSLPASKGVEVTPPDAVRASLDDSITKMQAALQRDVSQRNVKFFELETDKLDGWADDLKLGLEREIKEIDRQIKEARRTASTALTLETKLAAQKQIKALEAHRNQKRRSLFEAQDEIDKKRSELICQIEAKLEQKVDREPIFTIRWKVR